MRAQGFYDPVNDHFTEPKHTGISYSFSADGFFEESYYRAVANRTSYPSLWRLLVLLHHFLGYKRRPTPPPSALLTLPSNGPQMPKRHHPMATRQVRKSRRRLAEAGPHQSRRPPDVLGPVPVQELDLHALQRNRELPGTPPSTSPHPIFPPRLTLFPEIRSPHRRLPQNQAPQPVQI